MRAEVVLGEVEERVLAINCVSKRVQLGSRILLVRSDAAAAVNRAPAVGHLDVLVIPRFGVVAVVVIEERDVGVVALDQPSAGRVVAVGGQRQAGVLGQREHGLHQALAERRFAQNPGAVVILQRARHDLRRRRREMVDQHHDRIVMPVVAMLRV